RRIRPPRARPSHHRLPLRQRGPRPALSPHSEPPALAGQAAGGRPGDESVLQVASSVPWWTPPRRRLFRWAGWFGLTQALLFTIVGLRFLWAYRPLAPSAGWAYAVLRVRRRYLAARHPDPSRQVELRRVRGAAGPGLCGRAGDRGDCGGGHGSRRL